jgi:PadR family transcriptional regulator PadR
MRCCNTSSGDRITSSTNRQVRTYHITASGLGRLEQEISSFERMFEGISLVLNPGKSIAT